MKTYKTVVTLSYKLVKKPMSSRCYLGKCIQSKILKNQPR